MRKALLARVLYRKNQASISAHQVEGQQQGIPSVDVFRLTFRDGKGKKTQFYMRPDEAIALAHVVIGALHQLVTGVTWDRLGKGKRKKR